MTKYILPILIFIAAPAMAVDNCLKPKMDYTRDCADISNINNLPTLARAGDCAELLIDARSHWNASGLRLEQGKQYQLEVIAADQWCDGNVVTNYQGWDVSKQGQRPGSAHCPKNKECAKCKDKKAVNGPMVNLGTATNSLISIKWLRRKADSRLFALVGLLKGEQERSKPFEIVNQFIIPDHTAEFCAYANDASLMYGNNSGQLTLKIRRIK